MLLMILARAAPAQEAIRPVESVFEAQVELHRRGFSCGSIDGVAGPQTAAALRAFQRQTALTETGILDPDTRTALELTAPALTTHLVSEDELATLQRVPPTWLEKSQAIALTHANALELIAERYRASPRLVRRLNPDVNWDAVTPGTPVAVPAVASITFPRKAALLTIRLEARTLEAVDTEGRLLAHFPVSIARKVEKRPRGQLRITVVIPDPNYTFNPEMYPETPEAKESLTRKLIVPPGPNNPVGLAWVGLDLPGYGIHGTPEPEKVGRTESHGCFRLANWDAVALVGLVAVGIPVIVEP
jgi:lipoprotein-anchoring transpeptidase ErfK/SrfK